MKLIFALTAAAAVSSQPLLAAGMSELTPDQLQQEAISAVNKDDGEFLLQIMKEMQRREMLFFSTPRAESCDRPPQNVGVLKKHFARLGVARQAYFTHLRQTQMNAGSCGCLQGLMSYDEFLAERFGTTSEAMSEEQYAAMQAFFKAERSETDRLYNTYYKTNCRGE